MAQLKTIEEWFNEAVGVAPQPIQRLPVPGSAPPGGDDDGAILSNITNQLRTMESSFAKIRDANTKKSLTTAMQLFKETIQEIQQKMLNLNTTGVGIPKP